MRHFSGDFNGMRLLMEDELDLIAGGDGEDGDELPVLPEVIVVAHADHTSYYMPNHFNWGGGPGPVHSYNPEPSDAASIRVDVMINRPLTAVEQQALSDLTTSIQNTTEAIGAIPDTARVTLSNGKTVTGAELKEIWALTDFVINEAGFKYANGTDRGEANYANGNPVVSFNISTLTGYNQAEGGMNFLPLHELGHMTGAGRAEHESFSAGTSSYEQSERLANDIAWAIAAYSGEQILAAPNGGGYSPNHPLFTK